MSKLHSNLIRPYVYLAGCGTDWAVSPLSRLLTVLYLLVGLPIMYLYLMSTGSLMARLFALLIRGLMCKSSTTLSSNSSSRRPSKMSNSSKHSTPQHQQLSESNGAESRPIYTDKSRSTWQTRSSLQAAQRSSSINFGVRTTVII